MAELPLDLTVIKLDPSIEVNEEIDLRGEVCPYTFVKSKLALEEMEVGDVLRVAGCCGSVGHPIRQVGSQGFDLIKQPLEVLGEPFTPQEEAQAEHEGRNEVS